MLVAIASAVIAVSQFARVPDPVETEVPIETPPDRVQELALAQIELAQAQEELIREQMELIGPPPARPPEEDRLAALEADIDFLRQRIDNIESGRLNEIEGVVHRPRERVDAIDHGRSKDFHYLEGEILKLDAHLQVVEQQLADASGGLLADVREEIEEAIEEFAVDLINLAIEGLLEGSD